MPFPGQRSAFLSSPSVLGVVSHAHPCLHAAPDSTLVNFTTRAVASSHFPTSSKSSCTRWHAIYPQRLQTSNFVPYFYYCTLSPAWRRGSLLPPQLHNSPTTSCSRPDSSEQVFLGPSAKPLHRASLSYESIRRTKRRQRPPPSPPPSRLTSTRACIDESRSQSSPDVPASARTRRHVRSMFARAREADREGNTNTARALLQRCLQLDRQDSHSWLALARLEARIGGVNLRPDVLQMGTKNGEQQRGKSCGGAEIAREVFREGLKECPGSVHLMQAWAVLEYRCGDQEAARSLFERGATLEPGNAYVCQAWGLMEQRVGNTEMARELFSSTVSLNPHPEVCAAWAILEAREGNSTKARGLFERGLKSSNGNASRSAASICRSWADMEERMGDAPRARELLSRAIASQPHVTEPYIALANLEARRGCTTRALELMRTAAGLSSRPPASVFNAWAQLEVDRADRARALLERGLELHPHDPALLQSLGILEENGGNIAEAKAFFRRSTSARATAPAYVAWALLEEREGNDDEAVRLFEKALATDALHGPAYNAYGMMEARRGCLDRARAVYERGLGTSASASVWHGFGQLELRLGHGPDRAREVFRQGVQQTRENSAFIWHSWGMLELSQKRVLEARQVFGDAMKRYPRNSRILVGAALAEAASCGRTGPDETRARGLFKLAVAADPTHAHAWQTWGVFELRCGRADAAQALFRRGLRLCPSHGALWQGWGVLETERGNFGKARKLFERGVQACPSHVHLFQAWACMEVRAGNIGRARELLDFAIELDSCHGPIWNAYGLLEARHGTLSRARQIFEAGIKNSPRHAPLYRTFGQTEAHAGNYDKARRLFKKGLRIDPRHAPLYHALAQLEAMIGDLSALADLRTEAKAYFGSEADAICAMQNSDGKHGPGDVITAVESIGSQYDSRLSPMDVPL